MADEQYDIVFRGELVPGADLAQVKQNLSRLFKMDAVRIEALFSGKAVVLKRDLDVDTAGKYRAAIKKAGALIDTVASQNATNPPARVAESQQETREPASQPRATAPAMELAKPAAADESAATAPLDQPKPVSTGSLQLAPVGGDLLTPDEKRPDATKVDAPDFSLRPVGGALLDDTERDQPVPVQVNVEGMDLAPVGADVLKPEERQTVPPLDIDLSQLSIAPPGERLTPPKPAPPPAPDVKFSLVERR